jgi:hypothetical protein
MSNAIDSATARIQDIVLAMTGITIKSAPDYPIENADPFPFVASYAGDGTATAVNATLLENFPALFVEFHLSRVNIKQMQQQINAVVYEFPARLAGDPTLAGYVDTINFPISYTVAPFNWGKVQSQRVLFTLPVKVKENPVATT